MLSCIGNRRGEFPVVERGTMAIMAAMAKSSVPRMAMVSSIGVGDSRLQLLRLGFGGWIFTAIFATILRTTKADLNAAFATYQRGALVPKWPWKDSGPTHDTAARFYETAAGFIEERGVPVDVPRTGPASYLPEMGIVRPAN